MSDRLGTPHPVDELLLAALSATVGRTTTRPSGGQDWTVEEVEVLEREAQRVPAALITLRGSRGSTLLYRVVLHNDGIDYQRPVRHPSDAEWSAE